MCFVITIYLFQMFTTRVVQPCGSNNKILKSLNLTQVNRVINPFSVIMSHEKQQLQYQQQQQQQKQQQQQQQQQLNRINKPWEVIALEQLTSSLNAGPQQQRP